ncbi:hypothetical protein AC792_01890 [Arthrobacter sp. RIT-PI-e]|uniref:ATP-binding cassette domain-containing protein n=1 Tax=Arthrobacter sp. RIT-PI-e TaxID=1681197 RepID=UPI0006A23F5C|nr:ABC transporter ATP-binding protein [Arthrobacter sp. RIT-PI-e]KNC20238.1 hypothetical protein AC792_01890 [Arthrobacter sp. RIT-PI-e]
MMRLECHAYAYDDGGAPALADLTCEVRAGEYVVVAGASGSGKTTLARLLAGRTGGDAGAVFRGTLTLADEMLLFSGNPDDPRIDPAAWSAVVAYVAQGAVGQLSMMSATVAEEIAFGPSNRGVPTGELVRLVGEVAGALGLRDLLHRDPRRLSGGQLQRTVIAAAMMQRSRFLVLDEPFQGLDDTAAADVAAALDALRAGGTGVVVCEPMLPRSAPDGARVLGLEGGRVVHEGPLAEALTAGLGRFGIGTAGGSPRLVAGTEAVGGGRPGPGGSRGSVQVPGVTAAGSRELVSVRDVRCRYRSASKRPTSGRSTSRRDSSKRAFSRRNPDCRAASRRGDASSADDHGADTMGDGLRGVDLSVVAGEIVAVTGANGSGKSTLLQLLNGLLRADSGSVTVDGTLITRQATGALARHVGFLFQDTDQQLFERTVLREVSYGPRITGAGKAEALQRASDALERVGLGEFGGSHPYELGFVQRRLVALASIMAVGAPVWVLDEPTAGLDAATRDLLAGLLLQHAAGSGAVVLATHDAAFARSVASWTVRLVGGRLEQIDAG